MLTLASLIAISMVIGPARLSLLASLPFLILRILVRRLALLALALTLMVLTRPIRIFISHDVYLLREWVPTSLP